MKVLFAEQKGGIGKLISNSFKRRSFQLAPYCNSSEPVNSQPTKKDNRQRVIE